ncbi:MAG: type II secretion system protein GspC [Woeseiaceae bacterium]|nr:type II secretion system protein GspC [Woeseiaceae bacterium]
MASDPKWSDLTSGDTARTIAAANHLLPFWVSLVLVVIIAWQLASIFWSFMPGSSAGDSVSVPASQIPVAGSSSGRADVQSIANASIFGEADPDEVIVQEPVLDPGPDLEETKINLTLKGTIASDTERASAAVISLGSGDDQVFSIGEAVTSGASLHAVYSDRVVLNENGRLTALYLPEEYKSSPRPPDRRAGVRRQQAAVRTPPTESIQSVVSNNAARLSDVIRPTPYFVNGQQQGYRVYPGRDRRQFAALGLKAGDLIKDIDGQSLTNPQQAMQIFQSLGNASAVSVTVERDGQPTTLVLTTDQISADDSPERDGANE